MIITDFSPIGNHPEPQKHKNQDLLLALPSGWISPARPFIQKLVSTPSVAWRHIPGWECAASRLGVCSQVVPFLEPQNKLKTH